MFQGVFTGGFLFAQKKFVLHYVVSSKQVATSAYSGLAINPIKDPP